MLLDTRQLHLMNLNLPTYIPTHLPTQPSERPSSLMFNKTHHMLCQPELCACIIKKLMTVRQIGYSHFRTSDTRIIVLYARERSDFTKKLHLNAFIPEVRCFQDRPDAPPPTLQNIQHDEMSIGKQLQTFRSVQPLTVSSRLIKGFLQQINLVLACTSLQIRTEHLSFHFLSFSLSFLI